MDNPFLGLVVVPAAVVGLLLATLVPWRRKPPEEERPAGVEPVAQLPPRPRKWGPNVRRAMERRRARHGGSDV